MRRFRTNRVILDRCGTESSDYASTAVEVFPSKVAVVSHPFLLFVRKVLRVVEKASHRRDERVRFRHYST